MRANSSLSTWAVALSTVGLAACLGEIDGRAEPGAESGAGNTSGPGPGAGTGGAPVNVPRATCATAGGPAPVRRLTRGEYDNTVRDLLGDASGPARDFAADGQAGSFESNVDTPVTAGLANDYFVAAEGLAARANLDTLSPCMPAGPAGEAGCARQLLGVFGKRAFRRPLADGELARFQKLYDGARARGHTFATAIRVVIATVLQSPNFLNHVEKGVAAAGTSIPLSQYELASRLSYFVWQTMPDPALFAAADGGRLATVQEIEREARRMLADSRGKKGILHFYRQWLDLAKLGELEKNKTAYPLYSSAIGRAMGGETEGYVGEVLWNGDGKLQTMLTAPFSVVNGNLAKIYGVAGISGDVLRRADLDPRQRAGFLTQGSFLATHAYSDQSSPVHRGKFVREELLCQHTPSPNPDIQAMLKVPPVDPNSTTRQRWEALFRGNDLCTGCHTLLNPIGFSMENYDGIGQFRATENGQPVDSLGELLGTDVDGTYRGAVELAGRLARSAQVRDCMAKQWYVFALGRNEADGDRCAVEKLSGEFTRSGGDLRELVVSVIKSDGFRFREPARMEVCR